MKERPILFSAPMIRAILEGRKTQTRRVVKGAIPESTEEWCKYHHPADELGARPFWWAWRSKPENRFGELLDFALPCPYGKPGDLLWVRETHARAGCKLNCGHLGCHTIYRAEEQKAIGAYGAVKWTPAIHMPRWASRITLRITEVRVERLKDISDGDARAEGLYSDSEGLYDWDEERLATAGWPSPAGAYWDLWEHINGKGSVDANPFVWAVSFERVKS